MIQWKTTRQGLYGDSILLRFICKMYCLWPFVTFIASGFSKGNVIPINQVDFHPNTGKRSRILGVGFNRFRDIQPFATRASNSRSVTPEQIYRGHLVKLSQVRRTFELWTKRCFRIPFMLEGNIVNTNPLRSAIIGLKAHLGDSTLLKSEGKWDHSCRCSARL